MLPTFDPASSARARADLERMCAEFIPVRNVFWAAGVTASPLGRSLSVPLDRAGRVLVRPDLFIPGHPEIFVVGDMAAATSADTGKPVPGVAQGGLQMGRHAGELIRREVTAGSGASRAPFVYHDKGSMAVIGKARAVVEIGKYRGNGFLAWLAWGGVHIAFLIGLRNRLQVLLSWFWSWLLSARDARLITGDAKLDIRTPRRDE